MTLPPSHENSGTIIAPGSRQAVALSPEEWELILDALRPYRHNAEFRLLYKKLLPR